MDKIEPSRFSQATHAYIGIHDGQAIMYFLDLGRKDLLTAQWLYELRRSGAEILRFPIKDAQERWERDQVGFGQ